MNANIIAANSNFIRLNKILNRFNIFEATDMRKREVKHTKFLAFLLDPNESHGLGDSFLMSFLANLPSAIDIPLMSLNATLAKVIPEWDHIDIYVKIPTNDTNSFVHLFIENKLNASQGDDQLNKYSLNINNKIKSGKVIKLFLTQSHELAESTGWHEMTYNENVIPALKQIIEFREDAISEYLNKIIKDYIFIVEDDDSHLNTLDAEEIACQISKDESDIIKFLQSKTKDNEDNIELNNLKIKFAKAFDYLKKYDADERTAFLKDWIKINPLPVKIGEKSYKFTIESSGRSFLRFTVLTEENRMRICATTSKRKWLESGANIAFEIGLRPPTEKDFSKSKNYNSWSVLVLGPLDIDRSKFVKIFNEKIKNLSETDYKNTQISNQELDKITSPNFTTIVPARSLLPTKMRNLDDLKKAISSNLFNFDVILLKESREISFNKNFEKIIVNLNNALDDYFENI